MKRVSFHALSTLSLVLAAAACWMVATGEHAFETAGMKTRKFQGQREYAGGIDADSFFLRVYWPLRQPVMGPPEIIVYTVPATAMEDGSAGSRQSPVASAWKGQWSGYSWENHGFGAWSRPAFGRSGGTPISFRSASSTFPDRGEIHVQGTPAVCTLEGWERVFWVPRWAPIVITGVLPLVWCGAFLGRIFKGRQTGNRCPTCGYDLRATPIRCPECGTTIGSPEGPASLN